MATTTTTNPTLGEVLDAVEGGNVDTVRRWIDGGGDPNTVCSGTVNTPSDIDYYEGETPLMVAAMTGNLEVVRMLLQAGADVHTTRPALPDTDLNEVEGETESALSLALQASYPAIAQLLLDHGADKTTFNWMSPSQIARNIHDHRILRMFYIAGVDPAAIRWPVDVEVETFEEEARRCVERYSSLPQESVYKSLAKQYAKIVELFEGVRLAGSYKEFILGEYKQLLRMRSLLARGRATIKSKHHPVIARLFGGTVASLGSPKRSRPLGRFAGVPDPILWKVLEFYRLGDWRRPCTLPT